MAKLPAPEHAAELRGGEFLLWFVWTLGTLFFSANVLATKLFLVYLYGWSRVRHEHLRILSMPKGHPWPVSNGDLIQGQFSMHYLIGVFCWLALFFSTYPFLRLLLPLRKP